MTMMLFDRAFRLMTGVLTFFVSFVFATFALAQQPTDWQITFQESATPIMDSITSLNTFTLIIITVITLFVTGLLGWVIIRYNSKANPVPSKTSHNTIIEVVWTVAPILILLIIVAPSIKLLYQQLETPEADVVIKVTGYQWNWGYEYPDYEIDEYISSMLQTEDERKDMALERGEDIANYPRLLAVDNELVVPVGKVVRLDITSGDVLHAVALPSFGVKADAVPGRLNTSWFKAEKEGLYYGQCSQICGAAGGLNGHSFMPIAIRVVDEDTFDDWAASASEDLDIGWEILASNIKENKNTKVQLAKK